MTGSKAGKEPAVQRNAEAEHSSRCTGPAASAAYLANERMRIERENEILKQGLRSIFDVGIPPRLFPGHPDYTEYVSYVKDALDFMDRQMYQRNPELIHVPKLPVSIETDSSESDGLILQCKAHMKVWEEPCLVRLSDVLKKTSHFTKKDFLEEFTRYQIDSIELPYKGVFERHYLMPVAHTELNDCGCVYCTAALETAINVAKMGYTGDSILEYILIKVAERTRTILISEVRLGFQEEEKANLVDRIVSGFRSAVPLIVILSFEKFFRKMYDVGVDFAYEILKLMAPLIRHEWNYNAAVRFLNFWVDVHNRLSVAISAISLPLHAFEWKLDQYDINFRVFFWHFVARFVYELEEFQCAYEACLNIVFRQRKCWGAPKTEFSNQELMECVRDVNNTLINAKKLWERRQLPFLFQEIEVPKWNVFRMLQVRNPFKPLLPNQQEAYHVVECPKTGNQLYRRVDNDSFKELEAAEPILDVVFAKPGGSCSGPRFNVRVFKKPAKLSASETQDAIVNCDIPFLNAHGIKTVYKSSGARYIQEVYLKRRRDYNLDEVEGPLSDRLQTIMASESRLQSYRPIRIPRVLRKKKRVLCYPQHSRTLCIIGGKTRKRRRVVGHERSKSRARYYYRFGDVRYNKPDPAVTLFHAQRYDFLTEALSAAYMSATNGLNPLGDQDSMKYKYYVVVCYVKKDEESLEPNTKSALKPSTEGCRVYNMVNVVHQHYDTLEKYDLMSVSESLNACQPMEKKWAMTRQAALDKAAADQHRKSENPQRTPVVSAALPGKPIMSPSPYPVQPQTRATSQQCDGRRSSEPTKMPSCREPHKCVAESNSNRGTPPYEVRMRSDGPVLAVPANRDRAASSARMVPNPVAGRSVSQELFQAVPSPTNNSQQPRRGQGKGLPVNSGYAKTRQHLREKLKREKSQAQQQTQQGQAKTAVTVPLTPPDPQPLVHGTQHNAIFPNAVVKQKKPTNETVTTNQNPMGTGDVDQLVQLIEGMKVTPTQKPQNEVDPRKAAKKARQKEKKEQLKRQEEAETRAEAERLLRLQEEEDRRREEESRAEEARKKREKKKRRKKTKKEEAQGGKDEDSKSVKDEPASAERKISAPSSSTTSDDVTNSSSTATGASARKSSEMVTIRRHSTAPDTTVTISVKSETGDEDLLYTLVNGQVLPGKLAKTNENGSLSNTTHLSKSAGVNGSAGEGVSKKKKNKKKKGAVKTEESPVESGTPEDESSDEEDVLMPRPGAGVYNADNNMIVMNPDSREEEDEFECYNSDDYYYGRKEPGKFEEVVSSRVKRNRNRLGKNDEADNEKHSNGVGETRSRETTPALTSVRGGTRRMENGVTKGGRVAENSRKGAKGQTNPKSTSYNNYSGTQASKPRPTSSSATKFPTCAYTPKEENMAPRLIKARQEAQQLLHQQKPSVSQHRVPAQSPPISSQQPFRVSPSPSSVVRNQDFTQAHHKSYSTTELPAHSPSPAQYYSRFGELGRATTAQHSSVTNTFGLLEPFQTSFSSDEKLSCMKFQPSFIGDSGLFSQQASGYDTLPITGGAPAEVHEFHKAITRPTTNQSPSLPSSADHSTPTREVGSHSKQYGPNIEQRRSSWSWFRESSPEMGNPHNFNFQTPGYQASPAFSPTNQAPLPQYQQVSPVGYQRPQDQIFRTQSVAQPLRTGSSNQQLPSFEASLSSSNVQNISRPEPLHGNNIPFGSHSFDQSASLVGHNDQQRYQDTFGGNPVDYGSRAHSTKHDSTGASSSFNYGQAQASEYDSQHYHFQKPIDPNTGNSFFPEYKKAQTPATTKDTYTGYPKYSPTGAANYDMQRKQSEMNPYPTMFDGRYDPLTRALMFGETDMLNNRLGVPREFDREAQMQAQALNYERPSPINPETEFQDRRAISVEAEREIRAHVNEYYPGRDLGPFITMRNVPRNSSSGQGGQQESDQKPPATNEYSLF